MLSVKIESLLESVNTSACINQLLLAGEERMALGTDLDLDILLCGTSLDHVAASAGNSGLLVLRMNTFLHFYALLPNQKL